MHSCAREGTPGILAIHSSIVMMPSAKSPPRTKPVLIPYVSVGMVAARHLRAAGKPIAAMIRDSADGTPFSRAQVRRATDHGHPLSRNRSTGYGAGRDRDPAASAEVAR